MIDTDALKLTFLDDIEWTGECYSFDLTMVWRHEDGRLAWADDAGCSCPYPGEYLDESDITYGTPIELRKHLMSRAGCAASIADVAEFMERIGG